MLYDKYYDLIFNSRLIVQYRGELYNWTYCYVRHRYGHTANKKDTVGKPYYCLGQPVHDAYAYMSDTTWLGASLYHRSISLLSMLITGRELRLIVMAVVRNSLGMEVAAE